MKNNQNIHNSAPVCASLSSSLFSSGCSVGDSPTASYKPGNQLNQTKLYIYIYVYMCCPMCVCVCDWMCICIYTKKNKRPGSINGSHSFYRSLCVAQIVAKAGRACVDPPFLWENGWFFLIHPKKSCPGWMFQNQRGRKAKRWYENEMPKYLRLPPPRCFPNPLIRLCGWLRAHTQLLC